MSRPLSYDIITKQIGQPATPIRFVHVKCATCDRFEDFIWKSHHNPHHVSTHFKQLGWEFDKYRRGKIRCPDCQKAKPEARTTEHLPELKTFGQRFRYYREQVQLKRDTVADEAKFDRRMLEWLESGDEHPFRIDQASINRLIEVLRAHNVPVNRGWLLDLSKQGEILSTNVYRAMQSLSFTEGTLAHNSGVPISQVKLILSGTIPTHYKLPDLAKALRTTPEELMGLPIKGTPVKSEPVELVVLSPDLRAGRLREARQAKNLQQLALAELIHGHDKTWTVQTIKWMVSQIERGNRVGSKEDAFLKMAAEILDVPADWLLGRTADEPTSLDNQSGIPEAEAEEILQRIARAENDLVGLNQLIDEAIQPIRQMAEETKATIGGLKERLSRFVEPKRVTVTLPVHSVTAPVATPALPVLAAVTGHNNSARPRPVAIANHQSSHRPNGSSNGTGNGTGNGSGNGHQHNGRHQSHSASETGFIDRTIQTKQNVFARALKKIKNKHLNAAVIKEKIAPVIEDLLPPACNNPDGYVRALIQREVAAKNGLLRKTGRGYWQFREGAHI